MTIESRGSWWRDFLFGLFAGMGLYVAKAVLEFIVSILSRHG